MNRKSGIEYMLDCFGYDEKVHNSRIREFLRKHSKDCDIDINPAITPWCAAIMNGCERASGNPGTGRLNARSFIPYGIDVRNSPERGDICVFTRGLPGSGLGHVSYYVQDVGTMIKVLGGNQDNMVCYKLYPKVDLLAIRRFKK